MNRLLRAMKGSHIAIICRSNLPTFFFYHTTYRFKCRQFINGMENLGLFMWQCAFEEFQSSRSQIQLQMGPLFSSFHLHVVSESICFQWEALVCHPTFECVGILQCSIPDRHQVFWKNKILQRCCHRPCKNRRANLVVPGFGRFKHTFQASIEEFFSPKYNLVRRFHPY